MDPDAWTQRGHGVGNLHQYVNLRNGPFPGQCPSGFLESQSFLSACNVLFLVVSENSGWRGLLKLINYFYLP